MKTNNNANNNSRSCRSITITIIKMLPQLRFQHLSLAVALMTLMAVSLAPEAVEARAGPAVGERRRVTPGGLTCPPEGEDDRGPTLEEIYYHSDVVVMGRVMERHAQGRGGKVYMVEMDVYCVYKGDNVSAHINITNAGDVGNLCFTTDFQVGKSYMAYLKKHKNGRLSPAYKQHPEAYKDEMGFICDVKVTLPVGLSELPDDVICEYTEDYDYGSDYANYGEEGESQNVTCFSFDPKKDKTYKHAEAEDQEGGGAKKGQVKDTSDDNDDNGTGCLHSSLLSLATLCAVFLVVW